MKRNLSTIFYVFICSFALGGTWGENAKVWSSDQKNLENPKKLEKQNSLKQQQSFGFGQTEFSATDRSKHNMIREARDYFEQRGDDIENALKAAELFEVLVLNEKDEATKASFMLKQIEALYFFAFWSDSPARKTENHTKGEDVSSKTAEIFKKLKDPVGETCALTWAGDHIIGNLIVSIGSSGLASALWKNASKVPIIRGHISRMEKLGHAEANNYGYLRLKGAVSMALPWPVGSKSTGLALAKEAYEKTMSPEFGISYHGPNVIGYALALFDYGKVAESKEVIQKFVAIKDLEAYNSARIPETMREQAAARGILGDPNRTW
jgi:hypothetical protein